VGDAARFNHMTKQAQIVEVKAHGYTSSFAKADYPKSTLIGL
jgi:hypothetical protein